MKHTPGPWIQCDTNRIYGPSYAATVWGPKGPGYGLIADCRHCGLTTDDRVANAKLIAAAPELLEALEEMVKHCNLFPEAEYRKNAIAAITKAKGESK